MRVTRRDPGPTAARDVSCSGRSVVVAERSYPGNVLAHCEGEGASAFRTYATTTRLVTLARREHSVCIMLYVLNVRLVRVLAKSLLPCTSFRSVSPIVLPDRTRTTIYRGYTRQHSQGLPTFFVTKTRYSKKV
jgi:hypothetical protein